VTRRVALSSTQPPPNARPIGLYPAHSWVPGRDIGAKGERWKGWEGDGEVGRDAGPKVSKPTTSHHNQLVPSPHPLGYRGKGSVTPQKTLLPHLQPGSTQN